MNTIINKDNCLVYGLPGMAILIISLGVSINIGNDFGGSTFVSSVSFLGCNGLLWMLYLVIFQYLPIDILNLLYSKRQTGKPNTELQQIEFMADMDSPTDETETTTSTTQETETPVPVLTSEECQSYCTGFEQKKKAEEQKLTATIISYVNKVMASFVEEEHLPKLCHGICVWCSDAAYVLTAIPLKYHPAHKDRLKTIDFKHFVWNIASRLGFENGYSGQVQANFIKNLFPQELKDVEKQSLIRNLTSAPQEGHIKLDRALPGSYDFHLD